MLRLVVLVAVVVLVAASLLIAWRSGALRSRPGAKRGVHANGHPDPGNRTEP